MLVTFGVEFNRDAQTPSSMTASYANQFIVNRHLRFQPRLLLHD